MSPELIKCIQQLTANDPKTLSQKIIKTGEEYGELCRVGLPFEHAAGTIHRFVDKQRILEECVDVSLTVMSIAFSLGYDAHDIESMMMNKISKWGDIQHKERDINDTIPYEIHITVNIEKQKIESFKQTCERIGVKPIVIDLHNGHDIIQDVMTSSVFHGTNASVISEMDRIVEGLSEYQVVRKKIETVPWHPAAPQHDGEHMNVDCYFEAHLAVEMSTKWYSKLKECATQHNAHTSSNAFKQLDADTQVVMVTLRDNHSPRKYFNQYLDILKSALTQLGDRLTKSDPDSVFRLDKEIVEYAIFDDKIDHDSEWINSD